MRFWPALLLLLACAPDARRPGPDSPAAAPPPPSWTVEVRPSVAGAASCAVHPAAQVLATEPGVRLEAVAPDLSSLVYLPAPGEGRLVVHHLASGTRTEVPGTLLGYAVTGRPLFVAGDAASRFVAEVDPATGRVEVLPTGQVAAADLEAGGQVLLVAGAASGTWAWFPRSRRLVLASASPTLAPYTWGSGSASPVDPMPIGVAPAFALIDPPTETVEQVEAREAWRVWGLRAFVWVDPGGAGFVSEPGRAPLPIGNYPTGYVSEGWPTAAGRFFFDADRRAWLWDVANHTARVVASGVDGRSRMPTGDGRSLLAVRQGSRGSTLVLHDLATGAARTVLESPWNVSPVRSPDAHHVAVIADERDDAIPQRVRLFDAAAGREIPLPTVHTYISPMVGGSIAASFHRGGELLYVYDGTERILDAETGAELFSTRFGDNSPEGEGVHSYWGPDDDRFYMPATRYRDTYSAMHVWDSRTGKLTFLGDGAAVPCHLPGRDVVVDGVRDDDDLPHRLSAWDYVADRQWVVSETATGGVSACDERGVLFTEGETLRFGEFASETTRVVATGAWSVRVVEGQIVFNDEASICAVPVPKL